MVAMISQPMRGLTDEQIAAVREKAADVLIDRGYDIMVTMFDDDENDMRKAGIQNIPLAWLGKSLVDMANCDAVYFCAGWETARGCRIEHEAAKAYDVEIIYEGV